MVSVTGFRSVGFIPDRPGVIRSTPLGVHTNVRDVRDVMSGMYGVVAHCP